MKQTNWCRKKHVKLVFVPEVKKVIKKIIFLDTEICTMESVIISCSVDPLNIDVIITKGERQWLVQSNVNINSNPMLVPVQNFNFDMNTSNSHQWCIYIWLS